MSRLADLSRALTGGTPVRSPLLPPAAPAAPPVDPPPPSPPLAQPVLPRNQTHWLTADMLDGSTRTQSASAWAAELGLPVATLRWRVRAGWSVAEVLGLAEHPRDRSREQAASARAATNVLIVEGDRIVPRPEAARRLGIKKSSLIYRLRQYRRPDGLQAEVPFALLQERGRRSRFSQD